METGGGGGGEKAGAGYLKGVAGLNGGRQGVAVAVSEEKEVPLEVHATVLDAVHQVQLLQLAQARHQLAQLVVVHGGLLHLSLAARVRLVPAARRRRELHGREELVHADPAHVVPAERQQVQDHGGVRGVRDEVLDQVLQVPLEEQAFPAAAVAVQVAHGPALLAAAVPVVLVVDQVGGHGQRQVRGQLAQDLLLVLREQLLQDRVVLGNRGREAGVTVWGTPPVGPWAGPAWGPWGKGNPPLPSGSGGGRGEGGGRGKADFTLREAPSEGKTQPLALGVRLP